MSNMIDYIDLIFPNEKYDEISNLNFKFQINNNHIYFMDHDEKISSIIKYAKYGHMPASFKLIGNIMGKILLSKGIDADIITYVPMHRIDEYKRGFNQSYILAKQISQITKIKLCSNILVKTKRTHNQASLNFVNRMNNLKDVFQAHDNLSAGRKIIIVDDIWTTGATLKECEKVLLNKNASSVILVTISKNKKKQIY